MRKLPALATGLLLRLGPQDESFIGDLVEEYGGGGRSRLWYWRQVLSAVLRSSLRQIGGQPVRSLGAVATGWATSLLIFFIAGDRATVWLVYSFWKVDRTSESHIEMWPIAISALLVSYVVFAISAMVVVRVHWRNAGPMLIAYAVSTFLALLASTAIIELLTVRLLLVPVPHTLFFVISVALPYFWRSGLLLVPLTILIAGLIASPRPRVQIATGA